MRRPDSVWRSWPSTSNLSATPEVFKRHKSSYTFFIYIHCTWILKNETNKHLPYVHGFCNFSCLTSHQVWAWAARLRAYWVDPCRGNSLLWSTASLWRRKAVSEPWELPALWVSELSPSSFCSTRISSSSRPICGLLSVHEDVSSSAQVGKVRWACSTLRRRAMCLPYAYLCSSLCSHAGGSSEVSPSGSRGWLCSVEEGLGSLCGPKAWATLSTSL